MRVVIAVLALSLPAVAADHYVRDGGTCVSSCGDWNNAFDQLSSAEAAAARGDTIYVADGSYSGVTFNTANSGTTRIIVQKATVASHGTSTGWSDAYGDGQAVFSSSLVMGSGYWTIDGATGGGPSDWECSNCGFYVNGSIDDPSPNSDQNADSIIIRHIDIDGGSVTAESGVHCVILDNQNDFLMEYFFCHDIGEDVWKIRYTNSNITIQYGKVARSYQSAGAHGDLFEVPAGNVGGTFLVRWNYFEDVVGSYLFGVHEFSTVDDYEVYGNILHFKNKGSDTGNGTVGSLSGCSSCGWTIAFCNNTIAGTFSATNLGVNADDGGTFAGTFRSNLWYEASDGGYSFGYGGLTQSHNSHYNMASVAGTSNENPTGNPFTAISSNDLSLTGATTAGDTTGCPSGNSVDMFGTTRGADGTLDRGAIEFDEGGDVTPPSRSGISPSGTIAYTTSTTLSATTDEAATCKWSASSGTAYASMANTFSSTGGTSHSTTVSVSVGGNTFYIRCQDGSGNANTDDATGSFTVAAQATVTSAIGGGTAIPGGSTIP